MRKLPKRGDRVRVPFGLGVQEGVVVRVADLGEKVIITVAVEIEGSDEPILSLYRPGDIVTDIAAA